MHIKVCNRVDSGSYANICKRRQAPSPASVLCRLTWEIIKRHRQDRAIVLTTHSMEEVCNIYHARWWLNSE